MQSAKLIINELRPQTALLYKRQKHHPAINSTILRYPHKTSTLRSNRDISPRQDGTLKSAEIFNFWQSQSVDYQGLVSCQNASPFTGKEKDSETGFYYFGARYYDPTLSGLFLSVDPMADKYPSISPYAYCAWNPIKLVDPEGREVYITGDAAEQATSQIKSRGITVIRDEKTGKLSYSMTGKRMSKNDYRIKNAIDAKNVIVNINATNNPLVPYEDIYLNNTTKTGQFLGVVLSDGDNRIANAYQLVNPTICANRDSDYGVPIGTSMLHELTESFEAGNICLERGSSCEPCWQNYKGEQVTCPNDHVYFMAHEKATLEAKYMSPIYKAKMNEINFKIANVISGVSRADWDKFSKILK